MSTEQSSQMVNTERDMCEECEEKRSLIFEARSPKGDLITVEYKYCLWCSINLADRKTNGMTRFSTNTIKDGNNTFTYNSMSFDGKMPDWVDGGNE